MILIQISVTDENLKISVKAENLKISPTEIIQIVDSRILEKGKQRERLVSLIFSDKYIIVL
jgi:hypothetical protein